MAEVAANLVAHVLPRVPLRQFVFTVPFELRAHLAYGAKLRPVDSETRGLVPTCSHCPADRQDLA